MKPEKAACLLPGEAHLLPGQFGRGTAVEAEPSYYALRARYYALRARYCYATLPRPPRSYDYCVLE